MRAGRLANRTRDRRRHREAARHLAAARERPRERPRLPEAARQARPVLGLAVEQHRALGARDRPASCRSSQPTDANSRGRHRCTVPVRGGGHGERFCTPQVLFQINTRKEERWSTGSTSTRWSSSSPPGRADRGGRGSEAARGRGRAAVSVTRQPAATRLRALWLGAGLATHVGLAIFEEPERFITSPTRHPPARGARRLTEGENHADHRSTHPPDRRRDRAALARLRPGRMGRRRPRRRPDASHSAASDDRRRRSRLDGRAAPARGGRRARRTRRCASPVPTHVANVRSDTRRRCWASSATATSRSRTAPRSRSAMRSPTPGEAHWIGAGSTRGGARVHALMRLDREIRIGGAEGEDVLPLLCFRNGHDGGLAVTVSVAPFRLACLNGMLLPLPARAAHLEGPPHREHRGEARRRPPHARDRLALLRRAGGDRRAADRRSGWATASSSASSPGSCRSPSRRPTSTNGGRAVRNVERVREAIRTAYRTTPDLADIRGTALGRTPGRHRLRRPHAADPPHRHPHARRGALRARHRAAAAQGRRAANC